MSSPYNYILSDGFIYREKIMELRKELCELKYTMLLSRLTRLRYISNLSPECALALAATVNSVSAPLLRNFLNRHLSFKVFFDVSIVCSSALATTWITI